MKKPQHAPIQPSLAATCEESEADVPYKDEFYRDPTPVTGEGRFRFATTMFICTLAGVMVGHQIGLHVWGGPGKFDVIGAFLGGVIGDLLGAILWWTVLSRKIREPRKRGPRRREPRRREPRNELPQA